MKKIILAASLMFAITSQVLANENISQTLMKEWKTFRAKVETIKPDGDVGGYMLYREYEGMTLLWRTTTGGEENEVIRFFMEKPNNTVFVVTYHKSDIIAPGRVVLRRFVGGEPTGWINHTIDFETGKYLGTQGQAPTLTKEEKKMMKDWGITNF